MDVCLGSNHHPIWYCMGGPMDHSTPLLARARGNDADFDLHCDNLRSQSRLWLRLFDCDLPIVIFDVSIVIFRM